jgi:hypothetical protein
VFLAGHTNAPGNVSTATVFTVALLAVVILGVVDYGGDERGHGRVAGPPPRRPSWPDGGVSRIVVAGRRESASTGRTGDRTAG